MILRVKLICSTGLPLLEKWPVANGAKFRCGHLLAVVVVVGDIGSERFYCGHHNLKGKSPYGQLGMVHYLIHIKYWFSGTQDELTMIIFVDFGQLCYLIASKRYLPSKQSDIYTKYKRDPHANHGMKQY